MFTKASLVALACVVLAEATAVPSSVSSASDVNPVVTSTYTATKLYNTVIPG
ncbi:hypothetical protein EW026_g1913 [Hermanssonia centrifuga]|uniref:Uncharacterized protein n=1 Tax=Hermanssonia centrifuga TaxID=98765 RepID=A0A4S4KPX2_9APHY|nr:hypothetical protein EW026_g1913 [Hermanssonia centrifuga]